MARKKSGLTAFDTPKRKGKSKSLFNAFGKERKKRGKKSSLFNAFATTKRGGRKKKGIFDAFKKKGRSKRGLFSGFNGFGGLGGVSFGGLFGQNPYAMPSYLPDRYGNYAALESFMESRGSIRMNRDYALYYLLRFDDPEIVKGILREMSQRGFGYARTATWVYAQWQKFRGDSMFQEVVGRLGRGNEQMELAMVEAYKKPGVPKGVWYFLQDLLSKIENDKSRVIETDPEED